MDKTIMSSIDWADNAYIAHDSQSSQSLIYRVSQIKLPIFMNYVSKWSFKFI